MDAMRVAWPASIGQGSLPKDHGAIAENISQGKHAERNKVIAHVLTPASNGRQKEWEETGVGKTSLVHAFAHLELQR